MVARVPSYGRSAQALRVADLLTDLRDGHLRVPRFERGFKWKDTQRVALLDSIYQSYPIGALLVWRASGQALAAFERVGGLGVRGVPVDRSDADSASTDYLLDGFQRLTTLYAALAPSLIDARGPEDIAQLPRLVDDPGGPYWQVSPARTQWELVFHVDERTFADVPPDGRIPPRCVPLSVLFDTFQLNEFRRSSKIDSDRETARRIDDLQARLRDYQVPVIPLLHPELKHAIESFRRLNTHGTRMGEADLLRAASWRPEFDLSERLAPIFESLEASGWGDIPEDILVDICKLEVGLAPYSSAPERFGELIRKDAQVFERVAERAMRAATFLRERCGVYGRASLPYAFQFSLLAHALPAQIESDAAIADRATKWFWKTTWTHYFASQRKISRALKNLQAWLRGVEVAQLVDDDSVEAAGRFDFRRARDKALALHLARVGDDPAARALLLGRRGSKAIGGLIPGYGDRRFAAGNVVIVRDEGELAELRGALLDSSGPRPESLLAQHAIDATAHERLRAGDATGFVQARLKHLRSIERAEVESYGLRYVSLDVPEEPDGNGPLFDRSDADHDD